jgi:hypothetical protein
MWKILFFNINYLSIDQIIETVPPDEHVLLVAEHKTEVFLKHF